MKRIVTIFSKELKDILRDRRAIITMVVIPLLLFPTIIGVTTRVQSASARKAQEKRLQVAVIGSHAGSEFMGILKGEPDIAVKSDVPTGDIEKVIQEGTLDGAYVFSDTFEEDVIKLRPGGITLYYKSSQDQNITKRRLREPLAAFEKAALADRFQRLNLDPSMINPITVSEVDVASTRELVGTVVGGFLPYIFVIFCFIGSMIPAIDLGAGEKERGTLETLLTSPASRLEILSGKFMVVFLTGIVSALIGLFGLHIAFSMVVRNINDIPPGMVEALADILTPKSIFLLITLLLPLTLFFAGLLISFSVYARTFKEAQGLIAPVNFLVVLPVFIGLMPGIELNAVTALIPVLNVSLVSKEIFAGTINFGFLAEAYASLILLAGLGLFTANRFFSMESVIFRS